MTAGYSGKPLVAKLGIKPGARVLIVGAPRGYRTALGPLPAGVRLARGRTGPLDFIHVFARSAATLARSLPALKEALAQDGMLWVSWPKKTSGVATDVDENLVRHSGLALGLVDVKICAVDEVWSALKFVIPLKRRSR